MAQRHPRMNDRLAQRADVLHFYTANGWLTPAALGCGYVEKFAVRHPFPGSRGIEGTMWEEHGVLHVRSHDFDTGRRLFWFSYPYSEGGALVKARRTWGAALREAKELKGPNFLAQVEI